MTPSTAAALFALAVVAVVVGFLVITTYNAIVAAKIRIARAWANIDVALKQRHDQLPNLVQAVRGIMQLEQDVLERIAELRAAYSDRDSVPRQAATSEATSAAVRQLFAVVENYPELRSADNVLALQEEISRLEDVIGDRRELYNNQVFLYNARIAQVPANLVSGLFGWTPAPFFKTDEEERARPEVELGRA
ncbi:MAG: LemA family protein [Chloroflexi bacterium]|nr:LemA family protein [Chloroflexota bacterium]